MSSKANTKKPLKELTSKSHPTSHPHIQPPQKQFQTSRRNPHTPPASIHSINSDTNSVNSDSDSDSDSEYSSRTSQSDYIHSSYSSPSSLRAPETPSLESYRDTLDAQIIEYLHSHPDKPYLKSPSPSPPSSLSPSSLSHLDQSLHTQLLRSRRYGHLALLAYENELARQKLIHRISLLNIELREKGEEMKMLVVQELSEEQGVREEAMPSWMGEVLYWGGWEEGCAGFWEGWEGYWERFFREEGGNERENRKGVWKKWGREIRGIFGWRGKRGVGEDYEMM